MCVQADMRAGKHINITEDRAVMHMALRAPRGTVRNERVWMGRGA